jgi:GntR family transcriptional regulator
MWAPEPVVRSTRVPMWAQLAQQLRAAVERRELAAGEPLPSEAELVELLGVARMTVRQAYAVVEQEGLVVAHQGLRRRVADRPGDE